jgi:hypothetical protein
MLTGACAMFSTFSELTHQVSCAPNNTVGLYFFVPSSQLLYCNYLVEPYEGRTHN